MCVCVCMCVCVWLAVLVRVHIVRVLVGPGAVKDEERGREWKKRDNTGKAMRAIAFYYRTIKKRAKASWCEDRLRQIERREYSRGRQREMERKRIRESGIRRLKHYFTQ